MSSGKKYKSDYASGASFMAENQMASNLDVLCGKQGSIQQYRELGLNHVCDHCGHKEPWAVKNYTELTDTIKKVGIYAMCFGALLFFVTPICLLIAPVLLAAYFINKGWNESYIEKKDNEISQLPRESLPILVIDNEPIIKAGLFVQEKSSNNTQQKTFEPQKASQEDIQAKEQSVPQQVENKATVVYCRKCGAKMPSDSGYCPKCGEKVIVV